VTCGSLALGLFGGGPLLRWVWGPPEGFGEDYTTWQAFAQAVLAQAVFLLPAFAVCGLWMHKFLPDKPRWQLALLIANPLNVLIGYWLYFKLFYTGKDLDVELLYFNASGAILWSCMSLVVLAPVTFEGMRLRGTKGHFRNPLTDRTLPPPQR
jgi:hypothetical protein